MKKNTLLVIFFIVSIILCFVNIIVGLTCIIIFSIVMIVISLKHISQQSHCCMCNKKLTVLNTGAGGKLRDGGQLCISCLNTFDAEIATESERYSLEEMNNRQEEITKKKEEYIKKENAKIHEKYSPIIQPILCKDEVIEHLIEGEYNDNTGALTLTNQRLIFVYRKPVKKIASRSFLSETYYANLVTHEELSLSSISDVQLYHHSLKNKIQLFMLSFICEIRCFCPKEEAAEMAAQIKERAKNTEPKNIHINITINKQP